MASLGALKNSKYGTGAGFLKGGGEVAGTFQISWIRAGRGCARVEGTV